MKYFISLFLLFGWLNTCQAQDSVLPRKDSITKQPPVQKPLAPKPPVQKPAVKKTDTSIATYPDSAAAKAASMLKQMSPPARSNKVKYTQDTIFRNHPYFNFFGKPRYEISNKRDDDSKEGMFYLLVGVVLYFALVRLFFGKYVNNLFSVFFRVSLKQKQIREQLLQSPLPSLLLNVFFIISGGIYISFLLRYYNFSGTANLWYLILNSTIALGLIYLVKFLVLKMMGWIFNIAEATDTYVFVVFLVNKLLGILLIPFLVLLAFSDPQLIVVLITLSFAMVVIFFSYRYLISYAPVRKEIKVSQFHFFLYLCAFEIIPLLLIYKVLLTYLERSS
ncbi:MAG: DUF4271 domain-containing protein [Chitinophagaceae bacterium]